MSTPAATLLLAIIQPEDATALLSALTETGCGATYLAARGGFLQRHSTAVLIHAPAIRLAAALRAIQATCARRTAQVIPVAEAEFGHTPEPFEVEVGGAVIFGLAAGSLVQLGRQAASDETATTTPGAPTSMPLSLRGAVDTTPARLFIIVASERDADRIVKRLVARHNAVTTIGGGGGFLKRGATTILSVVAADEADEVAALVRAAVGDQTGVGLLLGVPVVWRIRL
jgi:uncharacterized protein YaaQ